ncbi:MAG TPA: hypothetical protein DCS97_05680 [Planctomycetes bacterium]|nr:hypothetical protein [Planctomycetota bacterium]
MAAADLADPTIIRDFRLRVLRFQQQVAGALASAPNVLSRTQETLRLELAPRWKKELLRRQDAYAEARRKWLDAENEVRAKGQRGQVERASSIDERRDMLKAQRRCEEVEAKLAAIVKWTARLDGDGKDLLARCRDHDQAIHDQSLKASAQLERLLDRIDEYLQRSGGPA